MHPEQTMSWAIDGESSPSSQTRASLLTRLRDLADDTSWRVFFDRYGKLIYNVARRSGLDDPEAQDVVQETVVGVARAMPEFYYDPAKGSFKSWLLRITRRRIADHLRALYRRPRMVELPVESEGEDGPEALRPLPAAASDPLQDAWESEWERMVFDEAVAKVRAEVNPKHFQVFDYCVLKGLPASRVCDLLSLNSAQVYLAKHRVSQAVKRAGREISRRDRQPGA